MTRSPINDAIRRAAGRGPAPAPAPERELEQPVGDILGLHVPRAAVLQPRARATSLEISDAIRAAAWQAQNRVGVGVNLDDVLAR
jgi:hypothetical protein